MLIAFIGLSVASVFAEATATLYLIRPASFLSGMIGKNVYVDIAGAQIGNLPNKKYIKLEIPANVEIEVGAYTTGLASIARKFMPIILDEGKTCYMQLTFTAEAIGTTNRYSSVMNKNVGRRHACAGQFRLLSIIKPNAQTKRLPGGGHAPALQ